MGEQLDEEQLEQLWQLSASQAVGRRRAQRSAGNTLMTKSQGMALRGGIKTIFFKHFANPPTSHDMDNFACHSGRFNTSS